MRAEADAQLRQQLQTLLKLPKDKWDEAVEHAKRAVFPDNRPRAWYADRTASVGLLFPATLGVVDLKRPEGAYDDHTYANAGLDRSVRCYCSLRVALPAQRPRVYAGAS